MESKEKLNPEAGAEKVGEVITHENIVSFQALIEALFKAVGDDDTTENLVSAKPVFAEATEFCKSHRIYKDTTEQRQMIIGKIESVEGKTPEQRMRVAWNNMLRVYDEAKSVYHLFGAFIVFIPVVDEYLGKYIESTKS